MKYQKLFFVQNLTDDDKKLQELFDESNPGQIFDHIMERYINPREGSFVEYETSDKTFAGESDLIYQFGDYELILNHRLYYVGLQKRIKEDSILKKEMGRMKSEAMVLDRKIEKMRQCLNAHEIPKDIQRAFASTVRVVFNNAWSSVVGGKVVYKIPIPNRYGMELKLELDPSSSEQDFQIVESYQGTNKIIYGA